jgi:hypothetical protein
MGNTVRSFSSLGTPEPENEPESDQENLGDALNELSQEERLGDFLANRSEDDGIDPVEAVREIREDV